MRSRVGVQRDLSRFAPVLHRLAEKGLGRIHIAISTQEEIRRPTGFVHSSIQVDQRPLTFIYVSSILPDPPRTSISAPAFLEFGQVMLDPSQNRGVRQPDPPVGHHDH